MSLNIEKYRLYLEGLELTRAQKEELIRTVWSFMEAAVDKAFGLHPVQQICGRRDIKNLQKPFPSLESKKAAYFA